MEAATVKAKRSSASHQPTWERFASLPATLTHPYSGQYVSVYNVRYTMLHDRCLVNAKASIARSNTEVKIVPRVIELQTGERSVAVGTITKTTPGRPEVDTAYHSSIERISYLGTPYDEDEDGKEIVDPLANYCSVDKDTIILEDESGRVELDFDLDLELQAITKSGIGSAIDGDGLATGIVVAVEGVVNAEGIMIVKKLHFPAMGPQDNLNEDDDTLMEGSDEDDSSEDGDVNIMFLSGLDCGGADTSLSLKRELLVDYLSGHFTSESGSVAPSKVARVIVAGGGCTRPIKPEGLEKINWSNGGGTKKDKEKVDMTNVTLPIKELDLFLSELCAAGIPVDYIPGLHDPTNANWPQKPLHGSLLPHASCFVNMLERSPNPYEAKIDRKSFLGSDGLNIADLKKFVGKKISEGNGDDDEVDDQGNVIDGQRAEKIVPLSSLETLESALRFNHLAPTSPDSLPTFPFKEKDPFVLEKTPHVFFAGNCNEFESKIVEHDDEDGTGKKKTCLICVPSFSSTGQVVLLNLKSLKCTVIEFELPEEISNNNVHSSGEAIITDEKKMG